MNALKVSAGFSRRIGGERPVLMLPLNVVLTGRVRGAIDTAALRAALEQLRSRHPLLGVRVQLDEDGTGHYVSEDVPAIAVHEEARKSEEEWLKRVRKELQMPFPIESGPLFRCALLRSENVSEILLVGHHVICDGMSLGYLLRDILSLLGEPEHASTGMVEPPPIDRTTVPRPPRSNIVAKAVIGLLNRRWAAKGIRFSQQDMLDMHEVFWRHNESARVIAWGLDRETTTRLVERCRAEGVTVNTALWAAFLVAQHEVQTDRQTFRSRSGLAVSTRNRLNVPVGEAFGFYASSLTVRLNQVPHGTFWTNARTLHARIGKELARTDLFRMLAADAVHPTLLDSLYFCKYGLLDEALPRKLLRKMHWHETAYGYAITNVGRFDIPASYGPLQLEEVYGPVVYSDVDEKVVGVITVGGRLSCIVSGKESVAGDLDRIKEVAMAQLEENLA